MKSNYFHLKNLVLVFALILLAYTAKAQCTPSFGYSTCVNGQMQFYSTSSNSNIVSYSWNFGNNTTSTQMNPLATYSANGIYTVCLTIFTSAPTCSNTVCQLVTINCVNPSTCTANFSYSNCVGGNMQFFNTSTGTNSTTIYNWNFGNSTTSNQQNPTATYTANGVYTVCLNYTTGSPSCNGSICKVVTINCLASSSCQANFGYSTCVNGQMQFYSTSSNSNIVSYSWNFGNSTTSNQQSPLATYSANGVYTVCLTIFTSAPTCSSTTCQIVTINCATPSTCTANFSYSNCVGGSMQFFNTSSGTNSLTIYNWNFGNNSTSNQQNPIATYTANGIYTVCLNYTTSSPACNGSICKVVTINCFPTGSCSANFTYSTCVNGQMQFINTSAGTGSLTTYSWNFGNSTNSNQQNPIATYSANGVYTVCLGIVSSFPNCSSTLCKTVSINCVTSGSCTANFGYSTCANGQMQFYNTSSGTNSTTIYSWNFGNSTSSNQQNPTGTYTVNGTYTVCLGIVTGSPACSNTVCKVITINCVPNSVKQHSQESANIKVYPNPSNGIFNLDIDQLSSQVGELSITVYNMIGVVVYRSSEEMHNGKFSKEINLAHLAVGAYYMRLNAGSKTYSVKTIIAK